MAEIVNLNHVRKQRARAEAKAQAATNRSKHGRTLVERERDAAETAARERLLDGARKDPQKP